MVVHVLFSSQAHYTKNHEFRQCFLQTLHFNLRFVPKLLSITPWQSPDILCEQIYGVLLKSALLFLGIQEALIRCSLFARFELMLSPYNPSYLITFAKVECKLRIA